MPTSVIFVFGVESALGLLTMLLLLQPQKAFGARSNRFRSAARWGGMFFLGITFCWSIVVGVVLSMNDMSIHF